MTLPAVERHRQSFARLLRGRGLEIGALMNPTPLPHATEVLFSDILTGEQIDRLYPGSTHPDIISDSEQFPTVDSQAFDFVIANHVLEHVTSPIRALSEWHRILKPGGLLLMALPDKRFTFDRRRQRTTLDHLVEDFRSDAPPHDLNRVHLLEWAEHVEGLTPGTGAFDTWVASQLANGYSVHNHVWVAQDLFELLDWMRLNTPAVFAPERWANSSPARGEFVLLLRALPERGTVTFAGARTRARLQHPLLELSALATRAARRLRPR